MSAQLPRDTALAAYRDYLNAENVRQEVLDNGMNGPDGLAEVENRSQKLFSFGLAFTALAFLILIAFMIVTLINPNFNAMYLLWFVPVGITALTLLLYGAGESDKLSAAKRTLHHEADEVKPKLREKFLQAASEEVRGLGVNPLKVDVETASILTDHGMVTFISNDDRTYTLMLNGKRLERGYGGLMGTQETDLDGKPITVNPNPERISFL